MATAAQLDALVTQVRGALAAAQRAVEAQASGQKKQNELNNMAVLTRAVESWATTQRAEVLTGSRTFARWRDYAVKDLLPIAASNAAEAGRYATEFARLAERIGEWALEVDKAVWGPVAAKVDQLGKDVAKLKTEWAAFAKLQAAASKVPLSAEAKKLLAEAPARKADLDRLASLHSALATGVSLLRTGKARAVSDGKGDMVLEPLTVAGAQTLGAVPVVGVGAVIATLAIATALAVPLFSWIEKTKQVVGSETAKGSLKLMEDPDPAKRADGLKSMELLNEAQKLQNEGSLSSNVRRTVGVVMAAAAFGGLIWAVVKLRKPARGAQRRKRRLAGQVPA